MAKLYLSPSRVAAYESCPRKVHYEWILRWKPQDDSATLEFGKAVHAGGELMLKADAHGIQASPISAFVSAWRAAVASKPLKFSMGWDPQSMEATGTKMLADFESVWRESGNQVMLDPKGEPLVERAMTVDCGDDVILRMKMDVCYMDADGRIIIADLKTPRAESPEDFAFVADQTCAYQLGVESTPEFGIDRIDQVQFIELIKLKTKTRTSFDSWAPRRPAEQIEEYLAKVRHVARDIRANWFPRRAGMAFNSPCSMCDFRSHCTKQEYTGINMDSVKESLRKQAERALSVPSVAG